MNMDTNVKKKKIRIFSIPLWKLKLRIREKKISVWNIFYTTTYRYLNVQKCKFQRKLKSKQFYDSMHLYNYFAWLSSAIFLNNLVAVNVKFTRLHYNDAQIIRSRMSVEWLGFFLRTIGNDCNCSSVKLSSVQLVTITAKLFITLIGATACIQPVDVKNIERK